MEHFQDAKAPDGEMQWFWDMQTVKGMKNLNSLLKLEIYSQQNFFTISKLKNY